MKFIIHDWNDADCEKILRRIGAVGKKGAKIVTCVAGPFKPPWCSGAVVSGAMVPRC